MWPARSACTERTVLLPRPIGPDHAGNRVCESDTSGSLWLFGGLGFDSAGTDADLNDLWKFDGQKWTWVSGGNLAKQAGVYGTKGTASQSNVPGARRSSVSWIDKSGNVWVFGGLGYDSTGQISELNDLWRFQP
jgi:N-acetylneuraminic acid mutarotase